MSAPASSHAIASRRAPLCAQQTIRGGWWTTRCAACRYALLREKLQWLRAHCVALALSVHHDVKRFETTTGVPFRRIWFAADVARFAMSNATGGIGTMGASAEADKESDQPSEMPVLNISWPPATGLARAPLHGHTPLHAGHGTVATPGTPPLPDVQQSVQHLQPAEHRPVSDADQHTFAYDLGFTGVVRSDQTDNWRYRIWRHAWPQLAARGLRLYSGPKGGVHVGVAHVEVNASEYVRQMRGSKAWLSTTGPSDLVGTRFFEVAASSPPLGPTSSDRLDHLYTYQALCPGVEQPLTRATHACSSQTPLPEPLPRVTHPAPNQPRHHPSCYLHVPTCARAYTFHLAKSRRENRSWRPALRCVCATA